jgi:hypothetical protein
MNEIIRKVYSDFLADHANIVTDMFETKEPCLFYPHCYGGKGGFYRLKRISRSYYGLKHVMFIYNYWSGHEA